MNVAVVGAQWGDEGKGKLVDILSEKALCCARYNGGSNAGHTLVIGSQKLACHLLPCGILHRETKNFIGSGVVLHLQTLAKELDALSDMRGSECDKQLRISSRCHLLFDFHQVVDASREQELENTASALGTTKRGIGPAYAAKAMRIGVRACDMKLPARQFEKKYMDQLHFFQRLCEKDLKTFDASAELATLHSLRSRFGCLVVDSVLYFEDIFRTSLIHASADHFVDKARHLVIEGANAVMLDINSGSYPYCTSSETGTGGIAGGLGLPIKRIEMVVGVAKAYCTRVGEGPFPTELTGELRHRCTHVHADEVGLHLKENGHEYGTTTGRGRRCGWLDIPLLKYAHAVTGFDSLMITKLDVLTGLEVIMIATDYYEQGLKLQPRYFPAATEDFERIECLYEVLPGWQESLKYAREFKDLPTNARNYIERVQRLAEVPIGLIGVGPDREDVIRVYQDDLPL